MVLGEEEEKGSVEEAVGRPSVEATRLRIERRDDRDLERDLCVQSYTFSCQVQEAFWSMEAAMEQSDIQSFLLVEQRSRRLQHPRHLHERRKPESRKLGDLAFPGYSSVGKSFLDVGQGRPLNELLQA